MSDDDRDIWRAMKAARREQRQQLGAPCPECRRLLPRAEPKILLPGQVCRRHNFRDPRQPERHP